MSQRRLVVVSNRLPVVVARDESGEWLVRPGSGGLVTALEPVLEELGGLWIGWSGVFEDELDEVGPVLDRFEAIHRFGLRTVALTAVEHDRFYLGFSNEVLWPLFHDLQSRCLFVPENWDAYRAVNEKIAAATSDSVRSGDVVWVHDYHLLLTGASLRLRVPDALIGFFLHIPFPPPDICAKLPWRREILEALLAYDLVGFQTVRDRRNFAASVRALLPEARVRGRGNNQIVQFLGRTTRSATFPIGIAAASFERLAKQPDVASRAADLRSELGVDHVLLGVDRLDYTKGVPFKLEALRRVLLAYPELHRRVALVQLLIPSRADIPEYQSQKREVEQLVGRINGELGQPGWMPVHYLYRSLPREELVAYYRAADVCLATPLKDGMNLVAKEYCSCQVDRRGVLVLSEFAGAAAQLGSDALLVNPYDIVGVAARIAEAIEMSPDERRFRMNRLQRDVAREDVFGWVADFLALIQS